MDDIPVLSNGVCRRVYILDTNVLLHDPSSIFRFQEHVILLPLITLEEIDSKKNDPAIGYNARAISQKLERLLRRDDGPQNGAVIPNGRNGLLILVYGHFTANFPRELQIKSKDNVLLAQVMGLQETYPRHEFIFVTKDRNLRIKMGSMGVKTEDYQHDKISEENLCGLFEPLQRLALTSDEINGLFQAYTVEDMAIKYQRRWRLRENEGVVLLDPNGAAFGLGVRKQDQLRYVDYAAIRVLGIAPKGLCQGHPYNYEQAICIRQALDDAIKVQIVIGKAGTGKTYLTMAAALQMVLKEGRYASIKLVKPIVTKSRLGEDVGFLPGSMKRKLIPKMRPFIEKLRTLTGPAGYHDLIDSGVIELVNIADVRGADMSNAIVIFDEAQNATPFQMRTLGTRLGEDTKLIVLGDPTQIDNIYLDQYSNALINLYLNATRYPEPFIAQVYLTQMVRSDTSRWFEKRIGSASGRL